MCMDARSGPGVRHGARHEAASLRPETHGTPPRCTVPRHLLCVAAASNLAAPITGRPGEKRAASMRVCRPLALNPQVRPVC